MLEAKTNQVGRDLVVRRNLRQARPPNDIAPRLTDRCGLLIARPGGAALAAQWVGRVVAPQALVVEDPRRLVVDQYRRPFPCPGPARRTARRPAHSRCTECRHRPAPCPGPWQQQPVHLATEADETLERRRVEAGQVLALQVGATVRTEPGVDDRMSPTRVRSGSSHRRRRSSPVSSCAENTTQAGTGGPSGCSAR